MYLKPYLVHQTIQMPVEELDKYSTCYHLMFSYRYDSCFDQEINCVRWHSGKMKFRVHSWDYFTTESIEMDFLAPLMMIIAIQDTRE